MEVTTNKKQLNESLKTTQKKKRKLESSMANNSLVIKQMQGEDMHAITKHIIHHATPFLNLGLSRGGILKY
jgi:ABC-type phosphate transport system auxiliary subunit